MRQQIKNIKAKTKVRKSARRTKRRRREVKILKDKTK
jgi:hypothetical protein